MKKCLIIVDVQNDFCPGGALATEKGNDIIAPINQLMKHFDWVVASKDWHPAETVHFDQWPVHCVRATQGAAFNPELNESGIHQVFLKGTGNSDDGYSAFEATNDDLLYFLTKNQVDTVFVCGIATEYCVKATAMDALKSGLKVNIITDTIAAVEARKGDTENALNEMKKAGIRLMSLTDFTRELHSYST